MEQIYEGPTEEHMVRIPSGEAGLRSTERKLAALEQAVRAHEQATSGGGVAKRPADHELYRRLDGDESG